MDWGRFSPRFWFQNEPTSLTWDRLLTEAMDAFPVEPDGAHTAKIGPFTVWTDNFPYAYGYLYEPIKRRFLPKVATRLRLRNALKPREDYSLAITLLAKVKEQR